MSDVDSGDWMHPERMKQSAAEGSGLYRSFNAYASGADPNAIDKHVITDPAYSRLYAAGLISHLRRLGIGKPSRILDVGCAIGTITGALAACLGDVDVCGIDLSDSAIDVARSRYPSCRFEVCSADELDGFGPAAFDLIHVREFYPFSRSSDAGLHRRFLAAFSRALRPGGVVAVVQIVESAGLSESLPALRRDAPTMGYRTVLRRAMIPQRLYARLGVAGYLPLIYPILAAGLSLVEARRQGQVSYLYLFRKSG